jgi:pimeloyl-ACP methyl ester carboxylesterase
VAAVASALLNRWLAQKAERRNPPLGRFITVDGVRLHYVERGTGTPLVLLHGNGTMIEDFQSSGLIDLAAKKYRVIAIDRPGFGYSERPRRTVWTPEAQADLIAAALKEIGVPRAIVLGHSWGTLVAVSLALKYPQEVQALILASGYYYPKARRRCSDFIAASHTADRRPFKLHHISYPEPADVAVASPQNIRPEPGSEKIRRLSRGDGRAAVSDPGQCC